MPRYSFKCGNPRCHRHIKLNELGVKQLREVSAEAGAPTAPICPRCVKAVIEGASDDFYADFPLGEQMIEAMKDSTRWRIVVLESQRRT